MNNFSQKPLYTAAYSSRKRKGWKRVFIIILLLQLILLLVFYLKNRFFTHSDAIEPRSDQTVAPLKTSPLSNKVTLPEKSGPTHTAALQAINEAFKTGDLAQAHRLIEPLLEQPTPDVIELLGQINMRRLKSSYPMPEKRFTPLNPAITFKK